MSEFHDPELRQELGRLSGPYPDDNAAFVAWQRRVGQVRRRRAVAWTTTAALSLIVAVVAAAAIQGAPGRHTLVPNKEALESSVQASTTVATTHAKSSTTESTVAPTTAPTTTVAPEPSAIPANASDTSMPEDNLPVEPGAATTVTTHKSGGSKGTSTSVAPTAPTAPPAPTTEAPSTHDTKTTVTSIGGTVTVKLDKGHLSVIDMEPTDHFEAHEGDHSDRRSVVSFTSSSHRSTITIWLENGEIKNFVVEKTETHGESAPGDTRAYGGGDGG
jgi:hypothetical protein